MLSECQIVRNVRIRAMRGDWTFFAPPAKRRDFRPIARAFGSERGAMERLDTGPRSLVTLLRRTISSCTVIVTNRPIWKVAGLFFGLTVVSMWVNPALADDTT